MDMEVDMEMENTRVRRCRRGDDGDEEDSSH